MTPRGMTRLKIWLVVVGVFILGCVTGASLDSLYRLKASNAERQEKHGRRDKENVLEKMKSDLNLTEQQATEIRAIIEQSREEYRALRNEVRPRYDAVRAGARARIRALLNPEQQQRFDAKTAERDARRGEGKRRERSDDR
jgi:Spy/CpxP family protein refolding chaperone